MPRECASFALFAPAACVLTALALLLNCHHPTGGETRPAGEARAWTWVESEGQRVYSDKLACSVVELRYGSDAKGKELARRSGVRLSKLSGPNSALLLHIKSERFTQIDVAVRERDGSLYDYFLVIRGGGQWRRRALPLADFVLNVRTSKDENMALDLGELTDEVLFFDHPGFMRASDFENTLSIAKLEVSSIEAPPKTNLSRAITFPAPDGASGEMDFGDYLDKVKGAWIGKLAGGALGLTIEGNTRDEIKNRYADITDYLVPVNGFQADDDTTYQICALSCLIDNDLSLDSVKLANAWRESMSPEYIWIGPREGMLNIVEKHILPPLSGRTRWGEMLCAAIRADIYGLVAPGRPEVASRYARADAQIDHHGEGVHAAVFTACAVSLAFFGAESPGAVGANDVKRLLSKALNYIPEDSEYAEMIQAVIALKDRGETEDDAYQFLKASYYDPLYAKDSQYAWAYAIPNGALVALGLLYGSGDFERSITLTAELGWDSDCNAATVGSILGAMMGASAIPEKWKSPLNNRFRAAVLGSENWTISQLSQTIAQVGARVAGSPKR